MSEGTCCTVGDRIDNGVDPASRSDDVALTVAIAACHRAAVDAWRPALLYAPGIRAHLGQGWGAAALHALVRHCGPDVLLLDAALLEHVGAAEVHAMLAEVARPRVLLFAERASPELASTVVRHRFHGLLSTAAPGELCLRAIRAVGRGELWLSRSQMARVLVDLAAPSQPVEPHPAPPAADGGALTPRECQIVACVRRGCTNKEIALELGIMEDTVKKHLQSVFSKLGVHRRALVALGCPRAGHPCTQAYCETRSALRRTPPSPTRTSHTGSLPTFLR